MAALFVFCRPSEVLYWALFPLSDTQRALEKLKRWSVGNTRWRAVLGSSPHPGCGGFTGENHP